MLVFSRGGQGTPRTLKLATFVGDALSSVRLGAAGIDDDRVWARHRTRQAASRVDPLQAEQVLLNLCLNARDAMPADGTLAIDVVQHERAI